MEFQFVVFVDPDRAGLAKTGQRWIARGLTYDFIGEAPTREGAEKNMALAVALEWEFAKGDKREPFKGMTPPPEDFLAWVAEAGLLVETLPLE